MITMNKSSGSSLSILNIWTCLKPLTLGLSAETSEIPLASGFVASEQEWMTKGYKDRAQTSYC